MTGDERMKQMAMIALEQATQAIAARARDFAWSIPSDITGSQALTMFADAIEATNATAFPKGDAH